ncbi:MULTISPECIES: hypothetical protein [unclassified Arsukibacterium]|uniref:hypothetical protein n=1 Tax=unclassified Arsukibacterium TaxID=2635278 RepID=UPI000C4DEEF4|nr:MULTISPECIES: hypothetical protein [unclassified Arsukibacterium]MAA95967.1 hypothetical protein [Rheinheimera sp.]MBM33443.1 hypothetical protein [Rheinheimera sp.]HAW91825.1 hypothetical protein [Candidatus Azambacteria bacterium]|tara:strand:- start:21715 stop:22392 length:678 start_codon:yes stop_codon:yes gene_type:complete
MDTITTLLAKLPAHTLPEYYIWLYIVTNLLWFALFCFGKQAARNRYQRLEHSLNLELERRRKVYELKICQYEDYCHELEAFRLRHQNDYQKVFLPLFTEFNNRYQAAEAAEDTAAASLATLWFSGEIQKVATATSTELHILDKQTAELKLSAADDVVEILLDIQQLYQNLLVVSGEQMNQLVAITLSKDYEAVKFMAEKLQQVGSQLQQSSEQLMQAIRRDLLNF